MKKTFIDKNCKYCGAAYKANKQASKYCSNSCKSLFFRYKHSRLQSESIGQIEPITVSEIEHLKESIARKEAEIKKLQESVRIVPGKIEEARQILKDLEPGSKEETQMSKDISKAEKSFLEYCNKLPGMFVDLIGLKILLSNRIHQYILLNNVSILDRTELTSGNYAILPVLDIQAYYEFSKVLDNVFPIFHLAIIGNPHYPFLAYFTEGYDLSNTIFLLTIAWQCALFLDRKTLFVYHGHNEGKILESLKEIGKDWKRCGDNIKIESIQLLSDLEPFIIKFRPDFLILDDMQLQNIPVDAAYLQQLKQKFNIAIFSCNLKPHAKIKESANILVNFISGREDQILYPEGSNEGISEFYYRYLN